MHLTLVIFLTIVASCSSIKVLNSVHHGLQSNLQTRFQDVVRRTMADFERPEIFETVDSHHVTVESINLSEHIDIGGLMKISSNKVEFNGLSLIAALAKSGDRVFFLDTIKNGKKVAEFKLDFIDGEVVDVDIFEPWSIGNPHENFDFGLIVGEKYRHFGKVKVFKFNLTSQLQIVDQISSIINSTIGELTLHQYQNDRYLLAVSNFSNFRIRLVRPTELTKVGNDFVGTDLSAIKCHRQYCAFSIKDYVQLVHLDRDIRDISISMSNLSYSVAVERTLIDLDFLQVSDRLFLIGMNQDWYVHLFQVVGNVLIPQELMMRKFSSGSRLKVTQFIANGAAVVNVLSPDGEIFNITTFGNIPNSVVSTDVSLPIRMSNDITSVVKNNVEAPIVSVITGSKQASIFFLVNERLISVVFGEFHLDFTDGFTYFNRMIESLKSELDSKAQVLHENIRQIDDVFENLVRFDKVDGKIALTENITAEFLDVNDAVEIKRLYKEKLLSYYDMEQDQAKVFDQEIIHHKKRIDQLISVFETEVAHYENDEKFDFLKIIGKVRLREIVGNELDIASVVDNRRMAGLLSNIVYRDDFDPISLRSLKTFASPLNAISIQISSGFDISKYMNCADDHVFGSELIIDELQATKVVDGDIDGFNISSLVDLDSFTQFELDQVHLTNLKVDDFEEIKPISADIWTKSSAEIVYSPVIIDELILSPTSGIESDAEVIRKLASIARIDKITIIDELKLPNDSVTVDQLVVNSSINGQRVPEDFFHTSSNQTIQNAFIADKIHFNEIFVRNQVNGRFYKDFVSLSSIQIVKSDIVFESPVFLESLIIDTGLINDLDFNALRDEYEVIHKHKQNIISAMTYGEFTSNMNVTIVSTLEVSRKINGININDIAAESIELNSNLQNINGKFFSSLDVGECILKRVNAHDLNDLAGIGNIEANFVLKRVHTANIFTNCTEKRLELIDLWARNNQLTGIGKNNIANLSSVKIDCFGCKIQGIEPAELVTLDMLGKDLTLKKFTVDGSVNVIDSLSVGGDSELGRLISQRVSIDQIDVESEYRFINVTAGKIELRQLNDIEFSQFVTKIVDKSSKQTLKNVIFSGSVDFEGNVEFAKPTPALQITGMSQNEVIWNVSLGFLGGFEINGSLKCNLLKPFDLADILTKNQNDWSDFKVIFKNLTVENLNSKNVQFDDESIFDEKMPQKWRIMLKNLSQEMTSLVELKSSLQVADLHIRRPNYAIRPSNLYKSNSPCSSVEVEIEKAETVFLDPKIALKLRNLKVVNVTFANGNPVDLRSILDEIIEIDNDEIVFSNFEPVFTGPVDIGESLEVKKKAKAIFMSQINNVSLSNLATRLGNYTRFCGNLTFNDFVNIFEVEMINDEPATTMNPSLDSCRLESHVLKCEKLVLDGDKVGLINGKPVDKHDLVRIDRDFKLDGNWEINELDSSMFPVIKRHLCKIQSGLLNYYSEYMKFRRMISDQENLLRRMGSAVEKLCP